MAKSALQNYLELAAGLGDLTRAKAKDAANEILTLAGQAPSPKKMGKEASRLAEDLVDQAKANRKMLSNLVRSEVDKAMRKVDLGSMSKDVQAVVATVAGLAAQVEELGLMVRESLAGSSAASAPAQAAAPVAAPVKAARKAPVRRRSPRAAAGATAPAAQQAAPAAKKAAPVAKKAPAAKKTAPVAKKAPAAKKTAPVAKKAPAAKKTAPAAKKAPAPKSTPPASGS
jgi:polyhydroxyalkanoate synthesis regulator phasin